MAQTITDHVGYESHEAPRAMDCNLQNAAFAEKKPIQLASRCAAHDDGLICIVQNDVYRDLREAQSSPGVLA